MPEKNNFQRKNKEEKLLTGNRVPPHNLEAEQAFIGCALIDSSIFPDMAMDFPAEAFYRESHGHIFVAMKSLEAQNIPIDLVMLSNELQKLGTLEQSGGMDYLIAIISNNATSSNWDYYKKIILEKYNLRKTLTACATISEEILGNWIGENTEAVDRLNTFIMDSSDLKSKSDAKKMDAVTLAAFNRIEDACHMSGKLTGIDTGFKDLNHYTSGLQKTDLIIVAARPSQGKTSFAMDIAVNAAKKDNSVYVFSMEMSQEQLGIRLISSQAMVDGRKLRSGMVRDSDWVKLTHAAGYLSELKLWINDSSALTLSDIKLKLKTFIKKNKLDMVIIDYIQLMSGSSRAESRQLEIAEISRGLKALAKELKVPIVALSQLNRKVEERRDKRPMMSDLRESGAIENDADMVIFGWRDDYQVTDIGEVSNGAYLKIAKNRNGALDKLAFKTDMRVQTWFDLNQWDLYDSNNKPF